MMNAVVWDEKFENLLLPYLPDAKGHSLQSNDSLSAYGLDSLSTVQVMLELEEAYDFEFPDELLGPETFSTPGNLWKVVFTAIAEK